MQILLCSFLPALVGLECLAWNGKNFPKRGPTPFAERCAIYLSEIADSSARKPMGERRVWDKEAWIHENHPNFTAINGADNESFIALAELANAGKKTNAHLFVDIENAVLKDLNDNVVLDKDFVTQLINFHKDLVWQAIEARPILKSKIVGKYSDFKSLRFAFRDSEIEGGRAEGRIQSEIMGFLDEINRRYADFLESIAVAHGWNDKGKALSKVRRNWHHAGIGRTPDQAGLAARQSRTLFDYLGFAKTQSFDYQKVTEQIAESILGVLKGVKNLKAYEKIPGFVEQSSAGPILSAEVVETILKATIKEGETTKLQAVQRMLSQRFGASFGASDSSALLELLDQVNNLSPGLLLKERVNIDYGMAGTGLISVDFKGQNARNIVETMRAIAESEGGGLNQTIQRVRDGEISATAGLRRAIDRVLRVFGSDTKISGDDAIKLLPRPLSIAEKKATIHNYLQIGEPSDIRLTFVDTIYTNGKVIPNEMRSNLVVEAEKIEKILRLELTGLLKREELNKIMIAVNYRPTEEGGGFFGIFLGARSEIPFGTKRKIIEVLKAQGKSIEFLESEIVPSPTAISVP